MTLPALRWPGLAPAGSGTATMTMDFAPYLLGGSVTALRPAEFARLDRLSNLEANWDGRGIEAPTRRAVQNARFWLPSMLAGAASAGKPWLPAHIAPAGEGELTFEWWRGDRKITLYFGDGARPEFLKVWGPHIQDEMDSGELDSVDAFRALWAWLHSA